MTCHSCRLWSLMYWRGLLWRDRTNQGALKRCSGFEYDPGTDEHEANR